MSSNNSSSNCDQGSKEDGGSSKPDYANRTSGESMYGSMNHSNSGYSANISKSSNSSQGKSSSTYEEPKKPKKAHKKFKHKGGSGDPSSKFISENGLTSDSGFPPSLSEVDLSAASSSATFIKENKAIKVAQLSQCLDIIGKLKKSYDAKNNQLKIGSGGMNSSEGGFAVDKHMKSSLPKQSTELFEPKPIQSDKDCFCVAISLHNGAVIHTTSSITSILGYPRDMWLGRSFMDFVYPKDRLKFTQQISNDVSNPIKQHISPSDMARKKSRKTSLFCRLRMYNGLRTGKFSIKERKTVFTPFKLIICFKEMENSSSTSPNNGGGCLAGGGGQGGEEGKCIINPQLICLLATCIPLRTAYSHEANLMPFSQVFVTKHGSDCKFIQVSESAIPFLGYMPQDIENMDIFNFYHPQDLGYLKSIYEKVINDRVNIVRSRPYRLRAYNGCYITVETDWSCFVNPWLKKLEFITGKHRVLQGPSHIDVFASPKPSETMGSSSNTSSYKNEESMVDVVEHIHSIRSMLKESFYTNTEIGEQSNRRRKELASFMGTLLEEMAKVEAAVPSNDVSSSTGGGTSTMVLGNIGPTTQGFSSNSPPSYNQLNYNENLYRFFSSHPHTLSPNEAAATAPDTPPDQSLKVEDLPYPSGSVPRASTTASTSQHRPHKPKKKGSNDNTTANTTTESGDSGELLGANNKDNKNESISGYSGSNSNSGTGSNSRGSRIHENSAPTLTEELLYEHNKGMEKQLLFDFKNNKKMLVSYKKTIKMPKKHLKNRHLGFTLQKSGILKSDLMGDKLNLPPTAENTPNLTSFMEIAKNCSHEKSSSSLSDINQELGGTKGNGGGGESSSKPPLQGEIYNPDSLFNSLAIESLLDGLENNCPGSSNLSPKGLKPPKSTAGPGVGNNKVHSQLGSTDASVKVEPGSILESSNIESLHSDFQNLNNAKNSFSEYGSSNSSSWLSFLRSTDETQCQSSGSTDSECVYKEEDVSNRPLEQEDKFGGEYGGHFNINKYVIDKFDVEAILQEDLKRLEVNCQSRNINRMFEDVYFTILKEEGSVQPLLDENESSISCTSPQNDVHFDLASFVKLSFLHEDACPFPNDQ